MQRKRRLRYGNLGRDPVRAVATALESSQPASHPATPQSTHQFLLDGGRRRPRAARIESGRC